MSTRFLHVCRLRAFIIPALFLLGGCAGLTGGKPGTAGIGADTDPAAVSAVAELAGLNRTLVSFKGLGHLTLRRNGQIQLDERVAWVGADPDKLSVVVMVSGFPAVRVAADGRWIYVDQPGTKSFRKLPASESTLAQILGIAISLPEVVALISGRVPLTGFRSAVLTPNDTGSSKLLTLHQWWGVDQKVALSPYGSQPVWFERRSRTGALTYRAVFEETMRVDDYVVPRRLSVLTDDDALLHLAVDRYWANVPVSPAMFVLQPIE